MLAEIQSKFDTSHTENQSMSSLLFDLKKEQKETFEKLNSLEEEKERLLEKIALSETEVQKKVPRAPNFCLQSKKLFDVFYGTK